LECGRDVLCELTEADLEVLVFVQSSEDGVYMCLVELFVELVHVVVQLVEINIAKALGVQVGEASHCVEISLSFQLLLFFLYLNVIMDFLLNEPRQLELNLPGKETSGTLVGRPLADFGSQLYFIVRQDELKEILVR